MIKITEFNEILKKEDATELEKNISEMFDGKKEITEMLNFDQQNSHHCYDLFHHTMMTVRNVPENLKIAAFFHDIGKPKVQQLNPNTKQMRYFGHAEISSKISKKILNEMGVAEKEIERICWLIGHHDDFITYKATLDGWMKNNIFLRDITAKSVREKIIENTIDFSAVNYSKEEIRYICYYLVYNEPPKFKKKGKEINFSVDIKKFINEELKLNSFIPTLNDYKDLLLLCQADVMAQSEVAIVNGKIVATKASKLENINKIKEVLEEAFFETVKNQ